MILSMIFHLDSIFLSDVLTLIWIAGPAKVDPVDHFCRYATMASFLTKVAGIMYNMLVSYSLEDMQILDFKGKEGSPFRFMKNVAPNDASKLNNRV